MVAEKRRKRSKMKQKKNAEKITEDMPFSYVLTKWPETADVFTKMKMHCIGCPMAAAETIRDGALVHNIPVKKLIKALNNKISEKRR